MTTRHRTSPPSSPAAGRTGAGGTQHEIKFAGYRKHARIERGGVRLLTRTGLKWIDKYAPIAEPSPGSDIRHVATAGAFLHPGFERRLIRRIRAHPREL